MAMVKVPEQKVILCGEYGVGKSSIFRRFTNNTFVTATDRKSTLGLDNFDKIYHIGDKDIKLQLWDTGGMERVASITSSYYKFSEAAILVFSLDNPSSFHSLSQHLLDIVTYAETAKIFLCGNKTDLVKEPPQISEAEIESFCEQCQSLITNSYQISCKTNEGVEEMFTDIAYQLVNSNRARLELQSMEKHGFKITQSTEELSDESCLC
ncbi:ras-related protein RabC isoform X1 [Harmonia axyridis]|uniref:ras-related protein RabC isoform X1 n=1 Tax=Harmonia axyridis TaxID=115357 RepID=UPI001E278C19|nr:ras-related protein RabC isoform X1 [Harmonia axyridis]